MVGRAICRAVVLGSGLLVAVVVAGCGGPAGATGGTSGTPVPTSGGASTTATGASPTTRPAGTPRCTAATLNLTLREDGAAAGSLYRDVVFTNSGSTACVIAGYPAVSFLTGQGGQSVGAPAKTTGAAGAELTLAPGQSGYATVQQANSGNYDPGTCQPKAVGGFLVAAPGDSATTYLPISAGTTACANTQLPTPQLFVRAVSSAPAG